MTTITREQLDSAYAEWAATMDFDFTDTDNRKRDAHVAFLRAQDAFLGTDMADATIKALYPELLTPALPEGRYRGMLQLKVGGWGYIQPLDRSVARDDYRVSARSIFGSIPGRLYVEPVEVEFSLGNDPLRGYTIARHVVVVGQADSEAAYLAHGRLPANPIQRRPRDLQEARQQAAERKAKGIAPRVSIPAFLSADKSVRDAAMNDYMDRYYEADAQDDSAYQQHIDVRSDLRG